HAAEVVEADHDLAGLDVRVLALHVPVDHEGQVGVDLLLELAQPLVGAVPRALLEHREHHRAVAARDDQIYGCGVLDHTIRSTQAAGGKPAPVQELTQSGQVPRSTRSCPSTA